MCGNNFFFVRHYELQLSQETLFMMFDPFYSPWIYWMKIDIYGSSENMHQRSWTVVIHIISRTLYLTACWKIFHLFGFQTLAKKIPISAWPYPSYLGHSENFAFSAFNDSWPDNASHNKGNDIYSLSNFHRSLFMEMLGYYPSYLNQLQDGWKLQILWELFMFKIQLC